MLKKLHLYLSIPAIIFHELTHIFIALLFGRYVKIIHFYKWNILIQFNFKKIKLIDLFIFTAPIFGLIVLIIFSIVYHPYFLIYIVISFKYLWLSKTDDNASEYIIRKILFKQNIKFPETEIEKNMEIHKYFNLFKEFDTKYYKIKIF